MNNNEKKKQNPLRMKTRKTMKMKNLGVNRREDFQNTSKQNTNTNVVEIRYITTH